MNRNYLLWFLSFMVFIIGIIQLLIAIQPTALDDAFVYYTYARNLTEGRPFAYDIRNIPSEGFTSLIYLLLLSPFEFLGINMLFASVVINLSAIIFTIWIACRLALASKILNSQNVIIFACLLWIIIINDSNIISLINMGLETMLGPLVILIATWAIWGTSSSNLTISKRALTVFFVVLFISYLIRPESFAFIALVGILLLLTQPTLSRRRILIGIVIFALIFMAYHLLKLAIFGDMLPTGFYRKTSRSHGVAYVFGWIGTYSIWLIPLIGIMLNSLIQRIRKNRTNQITQRWAWFLCGISVFIVLFFARVEPLVGYHFRFLMIPTFIIYITLLMAIVWWVSQIVQHKNQTTLMPRLYNLIALFITIFTIMSLSRQFIQQDDFNLWDGLNIYNKSLKASDSQIYLQLAEHLNQSLANPESISILFGDAGAIPYVFRGIFIDFNGLTEPPIAHLFTLEDGEEKTRQFTDYILAQKPDIVFLGWGNVQDGRWATPKNNHSPFVQPIPMDLFQSYYDFGFRYVCTAYSNYYEIHLGVWINSPYYADIADALISYCQINGYTLPDGITIFDEKTQREVHFEGISEVMILPRDS
jgi:hypothetical protein